MAAAAQKVSPSEEVAEAPLLDLATVAQRVRTLETTPDQATLHALAMREPTSFHQATINGLARQNTPAWRKYGLLTASIVIVFLQCFVAGGFCIGVAMSSCSENSECGSGLFCDKGICEWCEDRQKSCCLANATDTCATDRNNNRKLGMKDREGLCSACVTSKGFETYPDVMSDRVDSMKIQDWLALFLASIVVAFAVFAEIRDAMLCQCALRDISQQGKVPRVWRFAIGGLNFARYFVSLPNVVLSVMALVLADGGRVRDVCLNTVAVLFLLEVDNLAFLHGLSERARMEAEEHSGARQVTGDDLRTMDAVKLVCVVLIPCVVFGGVRGHRLASNFFAELMAPLPFIVAVFVQQVRAKGLIKGACGGLGWGMAGIVFYLGFLSCVITLMVYQAQGKEGFEG